MTSMDAIWTLYAFRASNLNRKYPVLTLEGWGKLWGEKLWSQAGLKLVQLP